MTKLLGETGLTLSTDILRIQGQLRYLGDWDREITDRLKTRPMPAVTPVVVRPDARSGLRREHRLVRTDVPAGRTRRFDYTTCKRAESTLYHRHVTVAAADSPLTLIFAKSGVWDAIKSDGWRSCAAGYASRRETDPSWSYGQQVRLLSEVRQLRNQAKAAEAVARIALAELIIERDTEIRPYTHQQALLRVRPSSPRQYIDLDFAEGHPELRKFVGYGERKAFTKWDFRPIGVDPEGDDENEDAPGIWS